MKVAVKNIENKNVGEIDLDDTVFGLTPRKDLLNAAVNYSLAKRRSGTHKTKTVSEIRGTGKKPHKQKGTGSARLGNLRGTQQRGGQKSHGPVVRDHAHSMNKKTRQLALKCALSAKQAEGKLVILDEAVAKTHKTKDMVKNLEKLGWTTALIVADGEKMDDNFVRATDNLHKIRVMSERGINVYDIMRRDVLVLTKGTVAQLEARLK